jgi:hypothetical protein
VLDALLLEARGIPTVTIIQDKFEFAARIHAEAGGLKDLPFLIEPSPGVSNIPPDPSELALLRLPEVVEGLTRTPADPEAR